MSDSMENLVETSNNLACIVAENGKMSAKCLLRSSVDSAKDAVGDRLTAIAEMAECNIELTGAYPGWKPNMESPIMNTCKDVYKKNTKQNLRLWLSTPVWNAVSSALAIQHGIWFPSAQPSNTHTLQLKE